MKAEELEFEREKIKAKEERIERHIVKLETDKNADLAKKEQKYQALIRSKETKFSERYDDLDDKYIRCVQEFDSMKVELEKQILLTHELERSISKTSSRELKLSSQFEASFTSHKRSLQEKEHEIIRILNLREDTDLQLKQARQLLNLKS